MEDSKISVKENFNSQIIDNISGALTLIALGVVFLLNTTGNLSWSVWTYVFLIFFSIWPIFLILWGIQIILDQSWFTKIISSLLGFVVFVVVLVFAAAATNNQVIADQIRTRNWATQIFGIQNKTLEKNLVISKDKYSDLEKRNLNMQLTAGDWKLIDEGDDYFGVKALYNEKFGEPNVSEKLDGKNLNLDFTQNSDKGFWFGPFGDVITYDMKVGNPSLATDLDLKITAGNGEIDFSDQNLKKANVEMTAGNLKINLSEKSLPEEMIIELTAGNFDLKVPENTGLEITYDLTAGNIRVDGERLDREDETFKINESASKKVKVKIDITAGNIEIKTK